MKPSDLKTPGPSRRRSKKAFTLVEMLVVIAVMSILMTAGAIGLGGMSGKGVTSGVATAESLFDEARSMAMGRNIRACVLVAKDLTNTPGENLRRIVVATEETNETVGSADFGKPTNPDSPNPNWVISSRGVVLPDQTFFSYRFSKEDHEASTGNIPDVASSRILSRAGTAAKPSYAGSYYVYEFNAQGIAKIPGASFVVGSGTRPVNSHTVAPKVTASGKSDFGGFAVWRSGQTSVFRSPSQISADLVTLTPGAEF